MPELDPTIIEHHIDTWSGCHSYPPKPMAYSPRQGPCNKSWNWENAKAGVYLPYCVHFVSNLVPIMKNKGTIRICSNFNYFNKACPKDNYLTPFINQIIDECVGHEVISFMDGLSGYNQILIRPQDQYKTALTTPWGTFYTPKLCKKG